MPNRNKHILQLTDLHYTDDFSMVRGNVDPEARLHSVLEHVRPQLHDDSCIILTGDLVYTEEPRLYEKLASIFSQLGVPVYCIPGNHDDYNMMKECFIGDNICHTDQLIFNDWLLHFLDTGIPGKNLGSGRMLDTHLEQLKNNLAQNSDKDIAIFMHHPPIQFGAKWFQEICLENMESFNNIIAEHQHVRAIIFGHAHTQFHQYHDGKIYICAPSTWVQFDHNEDENAVYLEAQPGGYNWYSFLTNGKFNFGTDYCL